MVVRRSAQRCGNSDEALMATCASQESPIIVIAMRSCVFPCVFRSNRAVAHANAPPKASAATSAATKRSCQRAPRHQVPYYFNHITFLVIVVVSEQIRWRRAQGRHQRQAQWRQQRRGAHGSPQRHPGRQHAGGLHRGPFPNALRHLLRPHPLGAGVHLQASCTPLLVHLVYLCLTMLRWNAHFEGVKLETCLIARKLTLVLHRTVQC